MEIKKYGGAFGVCHKPVHSEIKICMHQMHNIGAPSSPWKQSYIRIVLQTYSSYYVSIIKLKLLS